MPVGPVIMPCYLLRNKDGQPMGHVCGNLGPHCGCCGGVSGFLCDYPVGEGKTCDRPLCDHCAAEVAPDVHYCPGHAKEWDDFKAAGGVQRELENVVPFKNFP